MVVINGTSNINFTFKVSKCGSSKCILLCRRINSRLSKLIRLHIQSHYCKMMMCCLSFWINVKNLSILSKHHSFSFGSVFQKNLVVACVRHIAYLDFNNLTSTCINITLIVFKLDSCYEESVLSIEAI